MKLSRRTKIVMIAVLICVGLSATAFGGLYGWIQLDAHRKADAIWEAYPQANDKVEAVILCMQSPSCTMKERNQAIWVLGRLSTPQALPALEREFNGGSCEHGDHLCQYELKKAIHRCGGNVETLVTQEVY